MIWYVLMFLTHSQWSSLTALSHPLAMLKPDECLCFLVNILFFRSLSPTSPSLSLSSSYPHTPRPVLAFQLHRKLGTLS